MHGWSEEEEGGGVGITERENVKRRKKQRGYGNEEENEQRIRELDDKIGCDVCWSGEGEMIGEEGKTRKKRTIRRE